MNTSAPAPIAVDERACATSLGLSVGMLRKDRLGAKTIPFYRIGKSIRYDLPRVREALARVEEGGSPKPRRKAGARSKAAR